MSWNVLTFKQKSESGSSLLYPAPTPDTNGIEQEPEDGNLSPVATIIGIKASVRQHGTKTDAVLLDQHGLKGTLYLSDARLAFCFTKFQTTVAIGTGDLAVIAGVANLVSAARQKNAVLLGHVRHPWITSVGFSSKSGWLTREALAVTAYEDLDDMRLFYELDLTLDKRSDAAEVAEQLLSICAQQRGQQYDEFAGRSDVSYRGDLTIAHLSHAAAVGHHTIESPEDAKQRRAQQGLSLAALGGDALAEGMHATLSLLDESRPSRIVSEFQAFGSDLRRALEPHLKTSDAVGHALTGAYIDDHGERFLALVLTLTDRVLLCAKMGRQRHAYEVTDIPRHAITEVRMGDPDTDGSVVVEVIADQILRFEIDPDDECPPRLKERFLAALRD